MSDKCGPARPAPGGRAGDKGLIFKTKVVGAKEFSRTVGVPVVPGVPSVLDGNLAGAWVPAFLRSGRPRSPWKALQKVGGEIRTAAPHFEIGFGYGSANFNTHSVHTLSFSRFVASRSSGNHDS